MALRSGAAARQELTQPGFTGWVTTLPNALPTEQPHPPSVEILPGETKGDLVLGRVRGLPVCGEARQFVSSLDSAADPMQLSLLPLA